MSLSAAAAAAVAALMMWQTQLHEGSPTACVWVIDKLQLVAHRLHACLDNLDTCLLPTLPVLTYATGLALPLYGHHV